MLDVIFNARAAQRPRTERGDKEATENDPEGVSIPPAVLFLKKMAHVVCDPCRAARSGMCDQSSESILLETRHRAQIVPKLFRLAESSSGTGRAELAEVPDESLLH